MERERVWENAAEGEVDVSRWMRRIREGGELVAKGGPRRAEPSQKASRQAGRSASKSLVLACVCVLKTTIGKSSRSGTNLHWTVSVAT